MSAKPQNIRESWVVCQGLPIHYWESDKIYPDGTPAIIHLHGFGISGTYLLPAADLLAENYRTYVPDLHGYGRSPRPSHVLSIPELGSALVHFMDAAGIERATLIGNSMGCITAIETAQIVPDRVERVVLISPAGGPFNRPIYRGVAQLARDSLREPPRMFTIAIPDYLRFGFVNAGKLFWQMIHYPTVDQFKATTKPALVILGSRDPMVNEDRIVNGTAENPVIAIVRIDGAAHAINYSHPCKVSHLVRQFVESQPLMDDSASKGTAVILRDRHIHS